jgi:hypothetical protein
MKKTIKSITLICFLFIVVNSCTSSRKAKVGEQNSKNDETTEIKEPFKGAEYRCDKNYLRAMGLGISSSIHACENLGELRARRKLSEIISSSVQNYVKDYMNNYEIGGQGTDFEGKSEEITRSISNNVLKISEPIDSKKFRNNTTGDYMYYVVIQISRESLKTEIKNEIRKNVPEQLKSKLDTNSENMEQKLDQILDQSIGKQ